MAHSNLPKDQDVGTSFIVCDARIKTVYIAVSRPPETGGGFKNVSSGQPMCLVFDCIDGYKEFNSYNGFEFSRWFSLSMYGV